MRLVVNWQILARNSVFTYIQKPILDVMTKKSNFTQQQKAWAMYDWANSAYNLVITSTIFPAYYMAITTKEGNTQVSFLGATFTNSVLLEYSLAFAYFLIALLSPLLSALADVSGARKRFMQFYTFLGALSCMALFYFTPQNITWGIICSMLAAIGYCGSLVFYNAYLPEIAPPSKQDQLSALGYSYGYIGSVLLQIICFVFIFMKWEDSSFAPRLSFLLVGLWWLLFALYTFKHLPKSSTKNNTANGFTLLTKGYKELKLVLKQAMSIAQLRSYLPAFFFYSMGVQTVMLAATIFGSKEVKKWDHGQWVPLSAEDLIPAILVIQLVAIAGATFMARWAKKYGNFKVLLVVLSCWILICIAAYFTYTRTQFYALALCVGVLMGGIQSLSRSTYSKLIPQDTQDTTAYFSLYDVMEKLSIVLGMFSFAFIEELLQDMRASIIALIIFFILGFILLIGTLRKQEKKFI